VIVLGGDAAVERAARTAGYDVGCRSRRAARTRRRRRPTWSPSRFWSQRLTLPQLLRHGSSLSPAVALVDRANTLTLSVPEMTVLVGGMRALDANAGQSKHGVFTSRPGR